MSDTHNATPRTTARRPWSSWPNWINVLLGAYLAFSPLWVAMGGQTGWFIVLGILIAHLGLWGAAPRWNTRAWRGGCI